MSTWCFGRDRKKRNTETVKEKIEKIVNVREDEVRKKEK